MRSAGFGLVSAALLVALTMSPPALAQQSAPAEAEKAPASAAPAAEPAPPASIVAAEPTAAPAKPTGKPAKAKAGATGTPAATSAGTHAALTPAPTVSAHVVSNAPQVFLLKGLADIFSSGLDKLGERLRARGVMVQVASHASWDTLADAAIARYRAGQRGAIIVAGHSLGADAAIDIARRLYDAKVPVALVITFGPLQFRPVMGNVAQAVNYYQANSAWRGKILRGSDFKGSLSNIDLENAADVNHFNIEKVDRIQFEAVNKIVAAARRGGAPRKPASPAPATAATGEAAPATTSAATTEAKPVEGSASAAAKAN